MFDGAMRTLIEVRHVPELRKSLISLSTLEAGGCSYTGEGGVLKVKRGALVVIKGERMRSLYKLVGKIITGDVVVFTSSDEDVIPMWYAKFGH